MLTRTISAGSLALFGAGAGLAATGGGSGTAALVGAGIAALGPLAERFAALVGAELRGKPQLLADATLAGARRVNPEISEERVGEVLVEDDAVRALTIRVLEATRRTAREDKLRALGLILSQVAADPDRIDEDRLIAAALDDLEAAPQIETLRLIAEQVPADPPDARGWLDSEIEERTSLSAGAVLASLGTLTRHGLAQTLGGLGGGDSYRLTELGRAVLTVISAHDEADAGD